MSVSRDRIFGVLSALDVVYAHDGETIAEEILYADDYEAIFYEAVKDEYGNLDKLRKTVATLRQRNVLWKTNGPKPFAPG